MTIKMKGPLIGVILSLTALTRGLPMTVNFLNPAIELEGQFTDFRDASGAVALQSGPYSLSTVRSSDGKLGIGGGLYEAGELALGTFGKLSLKATTTLDGLFDAVLDTELLRGSRSFNPLTMSLIKTEKGMDYAGATDLGVFGGSLQGSTNPAVIPRFELHLNTNGWITGKVSGKVRNRKIEMDNYIAGVNLGPIAATATLDGQRSLQQYELSSSIGILHGSMITNTANNKAKSYRAGISLGVVTFDLFIDENQSRSYSTQVDSGIIKVQYNINSQNTATVKGSIDLANLGFDFEQNQQQTKVGGRIQVGPSVFVIHRICNNLQSNNAQPTCKFTVKVNKGSIVE